MNKIVIGLPEAFSTASSGLLEIRHEEDAECWLWAFPELFPWKREVVWLYTQPVGAGDLWGVDSNGDLLVIECKQTKRSDDPFMSFINPHPIHNRKLLAQHWQDHFPRFLKSELEVRDCCAPRPPGKTLGVLPRSNTREHIRRWPELSPIIAAGIRSPEYKKAAIEHLQKRHEKKNPPPYYLGLMVPTKAGHPILHEKAVRSARKLQSMMNVVDHVGVLVLTGTVTHERTLQLSAEWRSDLIQSNCGMFFQ